ncbi:MAG: sugar O-acetyltransferase [Saprospiraceae bacterium]
MSEKENMLAGLHYNSRDPELIERYYLVRKLLVKLNNSSPIDPEQRNELFTSLLGKMGDNVWIETPFFCDYGEHIYIDEGTFINVNAIFLDNNIINIGKNGLIGPGVQLLTASHPLSARERLITSNENLKTSYKTFSKPIHIGDNVWIGGNTVVLPGITIGNNVTIGAGSVVTKNIPDNMLAFGNPCKIIRQIP